MAYSTSKQHVSRRQFLSLTATASASLGALGLTGCGTPNENTRDGKYEDLDNPHQDDSVVDSINPTTCHSTTEDIEGPFYRDDPPFRTQLCEANEAGLPIIIQGRVYAQDCKTPLTGCIVDVWHADNSGSYDNNSQAFKMRGQMTTNNEGYYEYSTIMPGRYLNGSTYRPSHIHYKVKYPLSNNDTFELTTQLYFAGDPFLESDPWAQESRTIPLSENAGTPIGQFDIVLPVAI